MNLHFDLYCYDFAYYNGMLKLHIYIIYTYYSRSFTFILLRGRRSCDRMIIGFTNTYAISAYHH
jgi:hypothetical protein